jgi:hypothetical protein
MGLTESINPFSSCHSLRLNSLRPHLSFWQVRVFVMIHIVRHLFKAVHHSVKHSTMVTDSVLKPAARATPLVWMQAGKAHKHTVTFWAKIAHRGFKFWS